MNIAPDEKDKFGYRIAKPNPASQGAQPDNQRTLGNIFHFKEKKGNKKINE